MSAVHDRFFTSLSAEPNLNYIITPSGLSQNCMTLAEFLKKFNGKLYRESRFNLNRTYASFPKITCQTLNENSYFDIVVVIAFKNTENICKANYTLRKVAKLLDDQYHFHDLTVLSDTFDFGELLDHDPSSLMKLGVIAKQGTTSVIYNALQINFRFHLKKDNRPAYMENLASFPEVAEFYYELTPEQLKQLGVRFFESNKPFKPLSLPYYFIKLGEDAIQSHNSQAYFVVPRDLNASPSLELSNTIKEVNKKNLTTPFDIKRFSFWGGHMELMQESSIYVEEEEKITLYHVHELQYYFTCNNFHESKSNVKIYNMAPDQTHKHIYFQTNDPRVSEDEIITSCTVLHSVLHQCDPELFEVKGPLQFVSDFQQNERFVVPVRQGKYYGCSTEMTRPSDSVLHFKKIIYPRITTKKSQVSGDKPSSDSKRQKKSKE